MTHARHPRGDAAQQLDLFDALARDDEPVAEHGSAPPVAVAAPPHTGTPEAAPVERAQAPARRPALPAHPVTEPPTAASFLRDILPGWGHLEERRRDDIAGAVRAAARLVGAQPANLRLDVSELNERLFRDTAVRHRLSPKRFRNMLSLLRAALRELALHEPAETGENRLGPAWRGFLGALDQEPLRAGLRGFARWCDRHGVAPERVDDDVLARFVAQDGSRRLADEAGRQGPSLARAFARAARLQPSPDAYAVVTAPRRRVPYTIPIESYPASFQADLARFLARLGHRGAATGRGGEPNRTGKAGRFHAVPRPGEGPFTATAKPRRPCSDSTLAIRAFSIRQAAAALVRAGVPIAEITSLGDLVSSEDRVLAIIDFLVGRARVEHGGQLVAVIEVLRQIAKHHCGMPEPFVAWLTGLRQEAEGPRRFEMSDKAWKCLVALREPRALAALLALPDALERAARAAHNDPHRAAMLMRQAVVIDLLTVAPMRIGNLAGLDTVANLLRLDGPARPTHVDVPGNKVKNEQPIQWPLPTPTARRIQRYLDDHHPRLAAPGNTALFPGMGGKGALSVNALRDAFKRDVGRATGVAVHPHAMRHLAALLHLRRHPGQYEVVRRVLGHKDVETTKRFYTGLETDAAAAAFDEGILRVRRETRAMGEAALRRAGFGASHRTRERAHAPA